jgi:hypothetical protein
MPRRITDFFVLLSPRFRATQARVMDQLCDIHSALAWVAESARKVKKVDSALGSHDVAVLLFGLPQT